MKKEIFFEDNLQICDKSLQVTPEGYLMFDAIIARSGEQEYLRVEMGLVDNPMDTIVVDRPVEEVTGSMTVASFINTPVTDNHPAGGRVDAANFKELGKGVILDVEPTEQGKLKAKGIVYDADLVQKVQDGKRELSAGYRAEIEFSDDGNRAIQRKIRGNHTAFVDKARCGRECSILDAQTVTQEKIQMAKLKINGVEVEIQDSVAPMVKQVLDTNETLKQEVIDAKADTDKVQAKLDASTEENDKLKGQQVTDAQIQEKAEKLVTVWNDAAILDKEYDCKGKTEAEIKRGIVEKVLGDAVKDKSDAYIEARFDTLVEDKQAELKDPLSKAFKDSAHQSADVIDAAEARQKAVERKQNAWKGKNKA